MTGLLPQGCKTVNEAAAWAILEAHNGELQQRLGTKRTDQRVFVVLHFNLTHWLAQRNDRRIAELQNTIEVLGRAVNAAQPKAEPFSFNEYVIERKDTSTTRHRKYTK